MTSFSITYDTFYRFKEDYDFEVTKCRKVFNRRTGRLIKQVKQGNSFGYKLKGVFYNSSSLKQNIEKLPIKEYCPF